MTGRASGDARHSTIAAIAAMVGTRVPGADIDRLIGQITALELLPHHADGLLTYLEAHPDALTAGDATAPSALRRLLDVLAADHIAVQRTRCHGCGAQTRLPYRKDGASICGSCYRRAHLKMCVRCGQMGHPAFREGGGIVCTRCSARDPARWRACARCGAAAHVAYRVDGQPLCQKCGPHRLHTCSLCGRENREAHAVTAQGPICSICYRRSREHQCVQCGRVTVEARLADPEARTWICNRCWVPPSMMCTDCGQVKPCGRGGASGRPICSTCRARRRRPRTCAVCARDVVTQTTLPLGPVCGPCYRRIRRNPNDCATCGETRPLVGFNAAGGGVCGPCCSDERTWICRGCGRVDLLIADTLCLACTVKDRVNHLLTGPDGRISAQLHGVEALLLVDHTAEQTQVILNSCRWIRLLARLVAHGEPITHNALDRLEQTMHVRHLRHVLVDTGALEKRADGMEGLEPWLKGLLAGLPPRTATVLQRYVSWSLLPRTRRRATRGRTTVSSPRYVRTQILAAHQFLMWLETNQIGLAETTQHDVDTWLRRGASTRRRIRDFLRWAHDRGLADELEVGWLGRQGLPEQILDNDQRWTLLRRCLRDDSLPLRLRIAGALVLLYGQIPSRIVRLTTDGITTNEKGTYLALRKQPVLLPPLLAALITELVSANSAYWSKTSRIDSPAWLFPGTRAGSHLGSGRLTLLLNQEIGVFVRPARGAALSDLAGNLPAPILADLLGISVAAAGRWRAIAGSDDADYLAARTVTPPVANSLAW